MRMVVHPELSLGKESEGKFAAVQILAVLGYQDMPTFKEMTMDENASSSPRGGAAIM